MQVLSDAQFQAAASGGVPEPEPIDESLWSVPVPMPGGHLSYTLCTVHVGEGGAVTVVDPGWSTEDGRERLAAVLAGLGRGLADIATIVVTHAHPDHLGAAAGLRARSGARLLLHEREQAGLDRERQGAAAPLGAPATALGASDEIAARIAVWGVPREAAGAVREQALEARRVPGTGGRGAAGLRADGLLRDGDRLGVPGLDCEVVWTPGHTAGHICLVDRTRRLIMTGDHVLPTVFPGIGIGPGGGGAHPISDYLGSLEKLAPFDDYEVLPGHGFRFRGLGTRRAEMTEHILIRAEEVAATVRAEPDASVWLVASRLSWSAGWEALRTGPMLASALLQTELYLEFAASDDRMREPRG